MTRRSPILWLVLVLVGSLLAAGAWADQSEGPKEDDYALHKLLVDTIDHVQRNYVKEVDRRELIEAAIRGVLSELDPYSAYIAPDELDGFRTAVDSKFGGIGIQITLENGSLQVLSPLAGTPAYRAGILAGDRITEIDGKSTKGIRLEEAVGRLKGEEGTQVALTVVHEGNPEPRKITISRELIAVPTVLGDHRKQDDAWDFMLDPQQGIGYVRVTAFSSDTARELRDALEQLKQENFRAMILDLRFNPGGLLRSAVEVSDIFLSKGRIVSTKGRGAETPERSWDAHEKGTFGDIPMAVLVNRFSASGSEIVSACLQDHKRAVVIGERTWGKGSVQSVIELEFDLQTHEPRSALKLTTASYHRPSGKNIHRFPGAKEDGEWGVAPDEGYRRRLTNKEMMALVRDRRQRDIIRPKTPAQAETAPSGHKPPEPSAQKEPPRGGQNAPSQKDQPEAADGHAASGPEPSEFVDPHLRMAIDYLTGQLARAG